MTDSRFFAMFIVAVCSLLFVDSAHCSHRFHARKQKINEVNNYIQSPEHSHVVTYTYSPNTVFKIYTQPSRHTHIALSDDEGLSETPVCGDSLQWRVSGGPKNLYIKPVRTGISTTLTVVTDKRVYQFELISQANSQRSFQKISFDYPDKHQAIQLAQVAQQVYEKKLLHEQELQILSNNSSVDSLDFDFEVAGEAPFKPISVYSDDHATYLRMPNTQDYPAVFELSDEDEPMLVNYRVKNSVIIVDRIAEKLLLKFGKYSCTITHKVAP